MKILTRAVDSLMNRHRIPAAFLLAVLFSFPAVAQQGLTPEHVAGMKSVTSAAISPDARHIVYTLSVPADPKKENRRNINHLYLLDLETGESRLLYDEPGIGSLSFRPGHDSFTYLAQKEGDTTRTLYEQSVDGNEPVRLFTYQASIFSYQWAPDGAGLAFVTPEPVDSQGPRLPYFPEFFEENSANRLAYITDVTQEGHTPQQIMIDGSFYLITWSPDNSRLAVSVAPSPSIDDFYMHQDVFVVDAETGQIIADVQNRGKVGQIEWSPDGESLALLAGRDMHDPIDGRILTVSSDGGTPQILQENFEGKYEQISWGADNRIWFVASESTGRSYGSMWPDGSDKQRVVGADGPVLGHFDRSDGEFVLFIANTPRHPNEIYLMDSSGNMPAQITNNNPWLEDVPMGRQEILRYETRDGQFEIEGIIIYPVGYSEGDRIPVITQVHGGPEAHYSNGWLTSYSIPGQVAAAAGFAVFYPNYRGSTGQGLEFVLSSQGDAGGREFDDIVDGIDYLIEQGIADEDRIGVTGGSYGGYASGWMATYYSDRFAASVMFVGVSNNISKWGTSDIPDELYLVHARERLWDDNWMKYLERSPVYWVDRAETPILIMHGADDTRVHPAQSMELYRHLKVRKPEVPLRLIYYQGEGHGLANSTSRYDYTLRMMRWFDTYLMTGDSSAEIPPQELPVP